MFGLLPLPTSFSSSPSASSSAPSIQLTASTAPALSSLLATTSFLFEHSDSLDLTSHQTQLLLSHDVDGERGGVSDVGAATQGEREREEAARAVSLQLWTDTLQGEEEQRLMKEQLGLDSLRFDLPALPLPDMEDVLAEIHRVSGLNRDIPTDGEMREDQQAAAFSASVAAVEPAALALPAPNALLVSEEHLFAVPPIFTEALKPRLPSMPTMPAVEGPSSLPPMPVLPSSLLYSAPPLVAPPRYCASLSPPTEVLPGAAMFHFPSSMEGVEERTRALQDVLHSLTAASATLIPKVFAYTGDDPRRWEQPPVQPSSLANTGKLRSRLAEMPPLPNGAPMGARLARLLPPRRAHSRAESSAVHSVSKSTANTSHRASAPMWRATERASQRGTELDS